jgi:hypothetical protein
VVEFSKNAATFQKVGMTPRVGLPFLRFNATSSSPASIAILVRLMGGRDSLPVYLHARSFD